MAMLKNIHLWLPSYLSRRPPQAVTPTHVFFCFVDHYEPLWNKVSRHQGLERVEHWFENYPRMADNFRDADGRPPQHTFFYPAEQYVPEYLDLLARVCARGHGEVEIHLHHDNDTADSLQSTLNAFKANLERHGFLSKGRYGFIHGNWSLDNSRADGRWCGVNNELQVLRDTGCYADFTLPSAPSDCQTRKVNSIYYATDDPQQPKSHDTGADVCVGGRPSGDLLIVQGPLALNWSSRKFGLLPRIENGEVARNAPAVTDRVDNWVAQRIGVAGKPDWVFVKVHTHGCQEMNFDAALGSSAAEMHRHLQKKYNDGTKFVLHYVSAREVFNLIKAAEAGQTGDPNRYRDYVLPPPPVVGTVRRGTKL
ncbi:MAG TPA: hypothetical protein VNL17_01440 [Verrucomicrobiae bacterium]|nr:hypothetical protein [Verrucomicrobiae bacterium]